MTLTAILDLIKRVYPRAESTLSDDGLITFLNQELRTVYRHMQIEKRYEVATETDKPLYSLPSDVYPEDITYVGITSDATAALDDDTMFTAYHYVPANGNFKSRCWYIRIDTDGVRSMGLYPAPSNATSTIRIRYYARPADFAGTAMTTELDINPDWQMVLVYGVCAEVAGIGSAPDIEQSQNFTMRYNVLLNECKQASKERDVYYPVTTDVYKTFSPARRMIGRSKLLYEESLLMGKTPNDIMSATDPT